MPTARAVVDALIHVLAEDLKGVEAMARLASDEATSGENRAENKYDTRSLEASYLARGQAERVISLRRTLSWLQAFEEPSAVGRVALGAIVTVSVDERSRVLFLAPDEGGRQVQVDGVEVQVVTPKSSLARAILGLQPGDVEEAVLGGREVEVEVVAVGG